MIKLCSQNTVQVELRLTPALNLDKIVPQEEIAACNIDQVMETSIHDEDIKGSEGSVQRQRLDNNGLKPKIIRDIESMTMERTAKGMAERYKR